MTRLRSHLEPSAGAFGRPGQQSEADVAFHRADGLVRVEAGSVIGDDQDDGSSDDP